MRGKMEITIGVSVGSSIQIASGMIPILVLVAWPLGKDLTLYFANFEVSLDNSDTGMSVVDQEHSDLPANRQSCCLYLVSASSWHANRSPLVAKSSFLLLHSHACQHFAPGRPHKLYRRCFP